MFLLANCAIVCHLRRTLEEALPSTMTELYTKIVLNVVFRNLRKCDAYNDILSLPSFEALPKDLQQSFGSLCEFAFESLENIQVVFSQEELFHLDLALNEKVLCFGLLQCAGAILETGYGVSFHFLHLTIMEYLAALHLVKLPSACQLKVFQSHGQDSHFAMVLRFFYGIYCSSSKAKAVC